MVASGPARWRASAIVRMSASGPAPTRSTWPDGGIGRTISGTGGSGRGVTIGPGTFGVRCSPRTQAHRQDRQRQDQDRQEQCPDEGQEFAQRLASFWLPVGPEPDGGLMLSRQVEFMRSTVRGGELAAEQLGHLCGRGGAIVWVLASATARPERKAPGAPRGRTSLQRGRIEVRDLTDDVQRMRALERRVAGDHRVDHTAQAKQVAAGVQQFAANLLRRHVGGGADDLLQGGHLGEVQRGQGQAEVGDLDPVDRGPRA